jgi:hypothetical protein
MILIILRGPADSGKSSVCCGLKKKIRNEKSIDSCFLNLDQINDTFEINLMESLECKCVIGEMFYGNGHTTNPETWINRFKEKQYTIFSYILKASKETCLNRCIKDPNQERKSPNREKEQFDSYHKQFYNGLKCVNFAKKADIDEETIDTETKLIPEVVDIIFSKIESFL